MHVGLGETASAHSTGWAAPAIGAVPLAEQHLAEDDLPALRICLSVCGARLLVVLPACSIAEWQYRW